MERQTSLSSLNGEQVRGRLSYREVDIVLSFVIVFAKSHIRCDFVASIAEVFGGLEVRGDELTKQICVPPLTSIFQQCLVLSQVRATG